MRSGYKVGHQYFTNSNAITNIFVFNYAWNKIIHHYSSYSESGNKRDDVIGQWNVKPKQK